MRRTLFAIFAIGLLLFTLYGTGIAIAQAPITVIPVVEVRFRAGPDTKFDILGKIPAGASLTASARSPFSDWVKIDYNGVTGWIYTSQLRIKGNLYALPVETGKTASTVKPKGA